MVVWEAVDLNGGCEIVSLWEVEWDRDVEAPCRDCNEVDRECEGVR